MTRGVYGRDGDVAGGRCGGNEQREGGDQRARGGGTRCVRVVWCAAKRSGCRGRPRRGFAKLRLFKSLHVSLSSPPSKPLLPSPALDCPAYLCPAAQLRVPLRDPVPVFTACAPLAPSRHARVYPPAFLPPRARSCPSSSQGSSFSLFSTPKPGESSCCLRDTTPLAPFACLKRCLSLMLCSTSTYNLDSSDQTTAEFPDHGHVLLFLLLLWLARPVASRGRRLVLADNAPRITRQALGRRPFFTPC